MKSYIVLFILIVQAILAQGIPYQVKIIGGQDAADGEFPFQVSIQLMGGMGARTDVCSGVIYNSSIVISSALCVQGALDWSGGNSYLRIFAGSHDITSYTGHEQAIYAQEIYPHPNFNKTTGDFDIAYLSLREPLILNDRVKTIQLVNQNFEPSGQILTLGWGNHDPDWTVQFQNTAPFSIDQRHNWTSILQKTFVDVITPDECLAAFSGVDNGRFVNENNFCGAPTSEQGICARDGGGPALCRGQDGVQWFLCGITSWSAQCQQGKYPVVYTNVAKFRNWLNSELI